MKKNKVKLGLSLLTVLATPIAVNAITSHDVNAEYRGSIFYDNNKPANWWYSDGKDWYFFQNGKKLTGYGKDNAGMHYFVNGKYANGKIGNKEYRDGKEISVENKVPTSGYVDGVYYVDGKVANWWYDDGTNWYFFQNGKKFTGYGKDNAGTHYFVNGKYANWWYSDGKDWYFFQNGKKLTGYGKDNAGTHYFVNGKYANGKIGNKEYRDGIEISAENKVPTRGYANGVYYVDAKPANWWYDDGTNWYFFQNGKKLTGYGKDNAGTHYFVNGKYANWWYDDGTDWYFFQNGKKLTGYGKDNAGAHYFVNGKYAKEENKLPRQGYTNGVYYVDAKPANWWYDDGTNWYFFQNGKKLTGYGKDNSGIHYFVNGKYANWWYDDGTDWYFFQNGKKLTGYGKDNAGTHYFVNGKYTIAKEENKNTKRAIFLDPGHGGSDSGAVSNGLREKDLTLSVYNKVSSRLASLGYSVLTSRNTDKDVDLVSRADQANKSNADMFLSIHFNAGGRGASYGIETYYYKARPEYTPAINKAKHNDPERLEKSRKLAQKIQQSLVSKTGAYDRGVKRETFAVLRETSIPSILVELGFIDNREEANKIKTNEYQEKLADGIVDGIVEYYK